MSPKVIMIIRVILLVLLSLSIFHSWILWQELSLDVPAIPVMNSKTVKREIQQSIDVEKSYKLQSGIKDWQSIVRGDIFRLKVRTPIIENETPSHSEPAVMKKKEEKLEIPFALLAISKQAKNSRLIIADKATDQSYILQEGERIKEYQVKEIKKDKVILTYQGEDVELPFFK